MFPILLTLISGGWFGKWLDDTFKGGSNPIQGIMSQSNNYSSHVVTDSLLNVKFGIEENYILKTRAYQDAKKVWTIGIGVVNVMTDSGKFLLKVYPGLTLLNLKQKMNKTHLSDLQFCFYLMRNHVKSSKSYQVFKELDAHGIPYNPNLADSIIDFYYNSGSAYGGNNYKIFIQDLKTASVSGGDLNKKFASIYVKYRLGYLESWSTKIYGSWLRRVQIFADRIANNDLSMENKKSWVRFPTSTILKNYVASTYNYVLRRPLA